MFGRPLFHFSGIIILHIMIIGPLNSTEITMENVKLRKESESNSRGSGLFGLEGVFNPFFPSNVPIFNPGANTNFPTNSQFYQDNNVQDNGANQIPQDSGNGWQNFDNSIHNPSIYPGNNILNRPFQPETTPFSNEGQYSRNVNLQNYPYQNQDPYFSNQYPDNDNGFVDPYEVQPVRPNQYPYFYPNSGNNNNYPVNHSPNWNQGDTFNNRRPINPDQFNRQRPNGYPANFPGSNGGNYSGMPSFGGTTNSSRLDNNFSPTQFFNRTLYENATNLPGQGVTRPNDVDIVAIFGRPNVGFFNTTIPNGTMTTYSTETPIQRQCVQECPTTPEYNPLCGNNNVTYFNPSRLRCARECGIDVIVIQRGQCNRNTRPSGL